MERFSFIFTIFFMLLGPLKLIPTFAGLTQGADSRFKRDVAIRSVAIASVLCVFVALAGGYLVGKYEISLAAVRIAGGLVLLIAAFQVIFHKTPPTSQGPASLTAFQLAASPIAAPGIVSPAGVAAILIGVMLVPQFPGMAQAIAICLAIVMALDFLVMYFNDLILKTPGLTLVLTVLGSVLIFEQVVLAVEAILNGLRDLGFIHAV